MLVHTTIIFSFLTLAVRMTSAMEVNAPSLLRGGKAGEDTVNTVGEHNEHRHLQQGQTCTTGCTEGGFACVNRCPLQSGEFICQRQSGIGQSCLDNSWCFEGLICDTSTVTLNDRTQCPQNLGTCRLPTTQRIFNIVHSSSGLAMDIAWGNCDDGTNMQLWLQSPNNLAQQFYRGGPDGTSIIRYVISQHEGV